MMCDGESFVPFIRGTHPLDHITTALKYVTNWDLALDGGAHYGLASLLLAEKFNKVIAVEATPETYECTTENLKPYKNVEVYNVALGDKKDKISMGQKRFRNSGANYVIGKGTIEMIPASSLPLEGIGFIKLDIEGMENIVLQNLKDIILKNKPVILIEENQLWNRYRNIKPSDLLLEWGMVEIKRTWVSWADRLFVWQ